MILWCDGAHDAAENMRRDATLLAVAEAGADPVVRLFGFDPPGITLGRNQDPSRELDLARCTADGIGWAIRPTGGRAIFHEHEWTYSLAVPLGHPAWGGSAAESYARASDLILRALVRLGVPAGRVARRPLGPPIGPRVEAPARRPCFASTTRHEVVIEQRKLVGSAQRRTARALLQQGSILLGDGHLRIADYLAVPTGAAAESRVAMREALSRASCAAGRWLGVGPPLERLADALMAELPGHSARVDGASGANLLTVSGAGSYTATVVEPTFSQRV